ncbi:MAG: thiamine pyrophosphate-dependent enzyme [Alphaproteobacteria bacterium]|jgi:2-oxoglutarate ferredoxin oxidoreductase subunit beta|nr:thiamine pyrophosphate-dependent enzyme [Alphaproteobacteria bacterium]MDP6567933.1 thiamine pyrophosphate-dependent enzyme [Alphaproteobacteria bacterium]MDP6812343.1 thiamine pyrophosphate-dependent enzyme [Alphaproteobacteria bacterium]
MTARQDVAGKPDPMIPLDDLIEQYGEVPEGNFRYCPGCGLGMAQSALMRAFHRLQLDISQVASAGGSGCYSIMAHYLKSSHVHGSHGRGCAVATGMKLARPELTVLTLQGDGDLLAIGGNHFIHAARRNIDITAICFNNFGFGDTGGQFAPTTPRGSRTATSPQGMPEDPFDPCKLAIGAGATFVARSTVAHPVHLTKTLAQAIAWKGFAFVEVLQHCHVFWGRRNGMPEAIDMINFYRENSAFNSAAIPEEERFGTPVYSEGGEQDIRFVLGVLHQQERPEFSEQYAKLRDRAQAKARAAGR